MRRREFLSVVAGAAALPFAARAQPSAVPVIGFLHQGSPEQNVERLATFRKGLSQAGFIEGQNIAIEFRWANGEFDKLPGLAAELVQRQVALITTPFSTDAALAAKAATSTIPIVFLSSADTVQIGLVASLNRPGGNTTGVTTLNTELAPKRLGLLRELVPRAETIGVLLNPNFPQFENQLRDAQEAARAINLQIHVLRASTDREIDAAFETVAQRRIPALSVAADPFFDTRRDKLVVLAVRHAVPTMYHFREFAAAGGLVSYGVDISDAYRLFGVYTGRILKGAKPADLPVRQPTKFELVINLKTARALGLEVPSNLSARADEVIE
jgi:putative tryptophan/tyrosine transport system substrate-binding protein